MTLVLALACADGVLLAADGQQTIATGGQAVKGTVEKLELPWHNIAWAGSGPVSIIQNVQSALSTRFSHSSTFDKKKVLEIRKDLVQETARAVREVHARRINAPGFDPSASFLFAGCAFDGPFILEVHPDLTDTDHIGTGYSAIGSGDIFPYYAMASLTHYTVRDRTLMEAKLIACRILQDAINTAAFGLGLPISMVEVHSPEAPGACGTAQRLSTDDVRAVQDKILEWKAVETETLSELLGLTVVPEAGPVEDEPEEAESPTPADLPQQ